MKDDKVDESSQYCQTYEISCAITSLVIMFASLLLFLRDFDLELFLMFATGFTSFCTRAMRFCKKQYIMNHPLVYADICTATLTFLVYFYHPILLRIYYYVFISFCLVIVAAILSWNVFHISLVRESFILQFAAHLLISLSLIFELCLQ